MSLRGAAVTARVGTALGVAVAICFITGLISHLIQHPQPWFFWPTRPVWLYRLTQGLHVISGIAAIPLVVVKLWSVWPKLFERPVIGGLASAKWSGCRSWCWWARSSSSCPPAC